METAVPNQVTLGAVEPFGEYVRRVFSIQPFHHSIDFSDPDARSPVVVPCAATLYLYGSEESKFNLLLKLWHSSRTTMDATLAMPSEEGSDVTGSSFAAPSFAVFETHTREQLQHCLNQYFSVNWDRSSEVVALNNSYRQYIEYLYDKIADCVTCDPGTRDTLRIVEPPSPIREAALREAETASPKSSAADLEAAITASTPRRILVVFHAPFSVLSIDTLKAVRTAFGDTDAVKLAIVNVASQVDIVRAFDITRYPTLVLLCPSDEKKAPLALQDYNRVTYPQEGSLEATALAAWVSSNGTELPPTVLPTGSPSVVGLPRDELQHFASRREQHSQKIIQTRLGCDTEKCINPRRATVDDPPRFIFLGGGMAAGKTTSTAALAATEWWSKNGSGVVIVNADEFKFTEDCLNDPTLHSYSTKKAEELLVSAVNGTRDVVFDGTMMWAPFVFQVIEMVRGASESLYKNGRGYLPQENVEEYFVKDSSRAKPHVPYRIELVGAFADPSRTVPRAIVRELRTGRNVPTKQQLRSYKLFAQQFEEYARRVDAVVLYNTNVMVDVDAGETPPVCARGQGGRDVQVLDADGYASFLKQRQLNESASSVASLFPS